MGRAPDARFRQPADPEFRFYFGSAIAVRGSRAVSASPSTERSLTRSTGTQQCERTDAYKSRLMR